MRCSATWSPPERSLACTRLRPGRPASRHARPSGTRRECHLAGCGSRCSRAQRSWLPSSLRHSSRIPSPGARRSARPRPKSRSPGRSTSRAAGTSRASRRAASPDAGPRSRSGRTASPKTSGTHPTGGWSSRRRNASIVDVALREWRAPLVRHAQQDPDDPPLREPERPPRRAAHVSPPPTAADLYRAAYRVGKVRLAGTETLGGRQVYRLAFDWLKHELHARLLCRSTKADLEYLRGFRMGRNGSSSRACATPRMSAFSPARASIDSLPCRRFPRTPRPGGRIP